MLQFDTGITWRIDELGWCEFILFAHMFSFVRVFILCPYWTSDIVI